MSEKFQIITAIISVVTPIISIIISIVVSTKSTNSKIRDTQDKINVTQNTCNKLLEIIEQSAGIKNNVRGSLTDQHDALKTLIEKENHATYTEVHAMNVRSSEEKIIREEREKYLTPEMLEIKNVLAAVTNQNALLNDMKVELEKARQEIENLKVENLRLKAALSNADVPDFSQGQNCGRK